MKKSVLTLMAVSGFLLGFFSSSAFAEDPVRIMPLGDSVTRGWYGSPGANGYRKPLYLNLINHGYNVDFVGGQNDGDFADRNHEGHDCWHAASAPGHYGGGLLPHIYDWLVANPADIVLLHIGTNDITDGDQDANEVAGILDEIDRYSTDITVVLALIINRQNYSQITTQYNNSLNQMATNRIANGDDIIIVNMENALNYSTDMADNLHPNDSGYAKMANVWFAALDNLLKRTSPSIISTPKTTVIGQQLYTYDVDATGDPAPNYELITHPDGMTIDANTGLIEWTPAAAGDFDVTVKACNGETPDANQSFTITVFPVIEFDSGSSAGTQNNNTLSWTHTVGSGNNRLMVVGVFGKDSNSNNLEINSVKYNDIAMKLVDGSGKSAGSGSLIKTELYYLLDANLPPSGSHNVVVTYTGSVAEISAGAISFRNVQQQARLAAAANSQTSANYISTNITALTNGAWVVDIVGCDNTGTFSPAEANMTGRWYQTAAGTSAAAATRPVQQAGPVAMSWSNTSTANQLVHSAAAFTPVGCIISGNILEPDGLPISNVLVSADPNGSSGTTDPNGCYRVWVPCCWSGTVTPTKTECAFKPLNRTYSNITTDLVSQNYKNFKKYDLDKNGVINSSDLAVIYENWLDTGPGIESDLNNDNVVNFLDYTEFTEVCYSQ
jgi:lysophospholipase L1-like esterase